MSTLSRIFNKDCGNTTSGKTFEKEKKRQDCYTKEKLRMYFHKHSVRLTQWSHQSTITGKLPTKKREKQKLLEVISYCYQFILSKTQ